MRITEKTSSMLHGVLFMALFACAAFFIGEAQLMKQISFSPMIIGIILGMLYANTLGGNLPEAWQPGITFTSKKILRLGIVLYGFKLTFQDVMAVGLPAIVIDCIIVTCTIALGIFLGKLFKMDRNQTLLTSIGSSICGAAAVLGADSILRDKPYKTAVAVATVVIFGTLSMFLYPILYRAGVFNLPANQMGIFTGSTLHEVAHVVGAGNAMGAEIASNAIIVKMIRVMLLVPVLIVLGFVEARRMRLGIASVDLDTTKNSKVTIPWFAIIFLLVICFNSLNLLPKDVVEFIQALDTYLLTMAMTALGAETTFAKFRQAGSKPFLLALMLYVWLIVGGYYLARFLVPIL